MMKRGYILFLIISLLLPATLSAQSLSNKQRRNIYEKVLNVVESYESLASLSSEGDVYEFRQLFTDNATVDSDIIGDVSYMKTLPVDEYINRVETTGVYTEMRNVKKVADIFFKDDSWHVAVEFNKQLYYYDNNGVYFNVRKYYEGDYINVLMNLEYSDKEDVCYIESIRCNINSKKEFPSCKFIIVDNNNRNDDPRQMKYFSMLKANGKELVFDENGHALYDSNTIFSIDDVDIDVETVATDIATDAYTFTDFTFTKHAERFKFRLGYAPFAYSVTGNSNIKHSSNAYEVGVDYGATFRPRARSKMGFFVGAGMQLSSVSLGIINSITNTHEISQLVNNTGVHKTTYFAYTIKEANEQVSYMDLFVPIYFEIEHILGAKKRVMLSWNFGVKSYINLSAKAKKPYTATFNLTTEGNDITTSFDSFIVPNTYAKDRFFDISGIANLGVDYGVVKNKLFVNASIGYEIGILNSYTSSKIPYTDPIMPSLNSNIEHVAVNSLISGLSFRRNALWISLGIKCKF